MNRCVTGETIDFMFSKKIVSGFVLLVVFLHSIQAVHSGE